MKIACVYKITCAGNGRVYFGSTVDYKQRKQDHLKTLRSGKHCNKILQRSFVKYGEDSLTFEIVEQCEEGCLLDREQFWMDSTKSYDTGMNIAVFAGSGFRGRKWSAEDKAKQSEKRKEWHRTHESPSKGTKMSDAQKKILSEANRVRVGFLNSFYGKKHSDQTRQRLAMRHAESGRMKGSGNVMFGKTHRNQAREAIAKAQAGRFYFLDPNGKRIEVVNLKRFCRENRLTACAMGAVLKGRVNHHAGWTALICS